MQSEMINDILAIFSVMTFVMLGIVVYLLLAERKRKTDQKKLEEDTVEKLKDLSKETIELNASIKQSASNFNSTLELQSKSFEQRLQGQSELLQNYVEHTKTLLDTTSTGFSQNVKETVKKVQQFKNKLELVHDTTFKETKGKGLLGEAYIREILQIIFDEQTFGTLWFDPKQKPAFLSEFIEGLKELSINPDFLIKLSNDYWIVIDAKTYMPGEEAIARLSEFHEEGIETGSTNKDKVRKDIDAWIEQVKKAVREVMAKGYLDEKEKRVILWIVVPDALMEYYIQKNKVAFIEDNRTQLVSMNYLPTLLIELKARGMNNFYYDMMKENGWVEKLKTAIAIVNELEGNYKMWREKIGESLEALTMIHKVLEKGEINDKITEFNKIVGEIGVQMEILEKKEYNPVIRKKYSYENPYLKQ